MSHILLLNIEFSKALLEIIIMLLVAYLLGILTHWLMFRTNNEIENTESLQDEFKVLRSKYEATIDDRNDIQKNSELLLAEVNKLKLKNQRLEKLETEKAEEIRVLENKLLSVKLNLPESTEVLSSSSSENIDLTSLKIENSNSELNSDNIAQTNSKIGDEVIEPNFERTENNAIMDYLRNREIENKNVAEAMELDKKEQIHLESSDEPNKMEEVVEIIHESKEDDNSLKLSQLISTIGMSTKKDDLKQIHGIGPFIEEKLNSLGINSFSQISKLQDKDIDVLNDLIQFFPGRIQRDKWVEQAKALAS